MTNVGSWAGFFAALVAGALIGYFGSDGVNSVFGIPVFALCVAVAFVIQWVAFVPAWFSRTERFFDLVGSVTYIGTAALALILMEELNARAVIVGLVVVVWAARLGVFLTLRVKREGGDRRFNTIKNHFPTFLMTWTLQAVWVSVTFGPGLALIVDSDQVSLDGFLVVGVTFWLIGFLIEVVADEQKRQFRKAPENASRFIQSGLWRWSQHPNYFGEILLWFGIAVIAFPVLQGWQYVLLISPVFVWLLLTKISGVRMLDASARKRWGNDPEYMRYQSTTPVLILKPPRR
ncbi:MAG: DUF1295 domain-containing protein [Gammaproteobacteria bacterium]|nr:DUF1295 domain-containing protein [Gammaproteobacteria bacterium]